MRNKIIICLECLDYEYLKQCNTPNIDSLTPHPALSYGATTRASVPAILGGMLPICKIQGCPHVEQAKKMVDALLLTKYYTKGHLFLYVPNGWVYELLKAYMTPEFREKWWFWHNHHHLQPTKLMIEDFLQRLPKLKKPYFAYFHCMETHPPFYPPGEVKYYPAGSAEWWRRRKKAVEYVDKIIKPLLEVDCDDLVVTADHNIRHDVPHPDGLNVFIATRIKG